MAALLFSLPHSNHQMEIQQGRCEVSPSSACSAILIGPFVVAVIGVENF
jgi:hypothetical protein